MNTTNKREHLNIVHILTMCADIKSKKTVLFISDEKTVSIAEKFINQARLLNPACEILHEKIVMLARHGQKPPETVREKMLLADITLCLSTFSLAHSQARLDAQKLNKYFLSMPLYTIDLLQDPCLSVDYKKQLSFVEYVASRFTSGNKVHVTSEKGTDLHLNIENRVGNICPGFVADSYNLGSPPDIEANVSPDESSSSGVLVIDGSITCPEIGLLSDDVVFEVADGMIQKIVSKNEILKNKLENIFFSGDPKRRVLAELGVGLNPLAKLTGSMLTDEGTMETIHCGFGSNSTVGGQNNVDFHLDCVLRNPSLKIDGKLMMNQGTIIYD